MFTILVILVPIICEMKNSYDLMVALCFVLGTFQAIVQGGLFAMTSFLPPVYNGAGMTGQAVAGIVVCVIRIVTKLTFPSSDSGTKDASLYFFISAAVWTGFCAVFTIVILRSKFTQFYLKDY
eukprot:UN26321